MTEALCHFVTFVILTWNRTRVTVRVGKETMKMKIARVKTIEAKITRTKTTRTITAEVKTTRVKNIGVIFRGLKFVLWIY